MQSGQHFWSRVKIWVIFVLPARHRLLWLTTLSLSSAVEKTAVLFGQARHWNRAWSWCCLGTNHWISLIPCDQLNQSLNVTSSTNHWISLIPCDLLNQSLNFSYSMWLAEPITEFLLFHVTCWASHRFCFHWQIQMCDWLIDFCCASETSQCFQNLLEVDHELESVRLIHIFEFLHPKWLNSTPWQVVIIISFASLRTVITTYIHDALFVILIVQQV